MTNHWADIDNSSLILAIGANPTENHPACMAHVNAARFGSKKARLVVVDPRKTRTAQQADLYVRIRPGTDIAFLNAITNYIMTGVEQGTLNATFMANLIAWHNNTTGVLVSDGVTPAAANSSSFARTFVDDAGDGPVTLTNAAVDDNSVVGAHKGGLAGSQYSTDGGTTWFATPFSATNGWPKYCDSRVLVGTTADGHPDYKRATLKTAGGTHTFANMPQMAASVFTADTVYMKLKAHVANYTLAEAADICGCSQADIVAVANEWMANSRMMSSDFGAAKAASWDPNYKAATVLYAMGQTQHTYGSQNIRDLAILQTFLGNMGRPGGGINALRGIHNVQGSTDMSTLFDGIPGYSGNPGADYAAYANPLFGNRLIGTGAKDKYNPAQLGLQQRGFYNMTTQWFGKTPAALRAGTEFEALYALWPKGNGVDHITAFRQMSTGPITAAVVWGQNPAVTEPNQSAVRAGLENLDLLVCVDIFENETAACSRKSAGVTYLLPACSHVEEAGSVTNSGRWIQWRDRAVPPKGNSKADLELLLRLAKALDVAGAFSHISGKWTASNPDLAADLTAGKSVWDVLYGKYCTGWDGVAAGGFEALTFTDSDRKFPGGAAYGTVLGSEAVAENVFKEIAQPLDANGNIGGGGTLWIYSGNTVDGAYNSGSTGNVSPATTDTIAASGLTQTAVGWNVVNRAKSRNSSFSGESFTYPRYGYSWLLNRRVFYNNSEVYNDSNDVFVAPGVMSRMMTFTSDNHNATADWSLLYRYYNSVKDVPSVTGGPHAAGLPGNFPAFTEPMETPRRDLAAKYGRNRVLNATVGNPPTNTIKPDTTAALWSSTDPAYAADAAYGSWAAPANTAWGKDAKDYPLVLTTIRCVEHFQGGPITRNNTWNVEAEPVPWIEINSVDARKYGIADGDWVNVVTPRSNSTTQQEGRTVGTGWAKGFKARVGVGLQGNQRVAPGVVAIPWHWGDKGLSTGSRANDLCIDAFDANTIIPEYKACLCRISTNVNDVPA